MSPMDGRRQSMKYLPLAAGALVGVLLMGLLVWWIHGFMASNAQKPSRMVQNITVIRPPPPPPDEPPPPPPPPDKVEQQVQQTPPDPTPDNAPAPPPSLGLDAEGSAGGDAFGLAARKGGSDLVGGGGAVFAWYQKKIEGAISDRLSADNRLHGKKFTVELRISIRSDGSIAIEQIVHGTGDSQVDGIVTADLNGSSVHVDEAPPL